MDKKVSENESETKKGYHKADIIKLWIGNESSLNKISTVEMFYCYLNNFICM